MGAVFYTNSAMPADYRQGILTREMDGLNNAGFGAFPALDAFFSVMDNASALPIR